MCTIYDNWVHFDNLLCFRLFFDHLGTILLMAVIGTIFNMLTIGNYCNIYLFLSIYAYINSKKKKKILSPRIIY